MKPPVFTLVGPTASGKSDLALHLAALFPEDLEVVNADALQLFRRLDIGTAKPTPEQLARVPHHLYNVLEPDEEVTASWYSARTREVLAEIHARKHFPLLVGGSGFYLRALEHPPVAPPAESEVTETLEEAYGFLKERDPEAARKIHPNDSYRIRRATALLRSGHTPSESFERAGESETPFRMVWIGLQPERAQLHERIAERSRWMFDQGLPEETKAVRHDFPRAERRLRRSIGYGECLRFLDGEIQKDKAVDLTLFRSRQYAKRQVTWFRKEPRIQWLPERRELDSARKIIEENLSCR